MLMLMLLNFLNLDCEMEEEEGRTKRERENKIPEKVSPTGNDEKETVERLINPNNKVIKERVEPTWRASPEEEEEKAEASGPINHHHTAKVKHYCRLRPRESVCRGRA